MLGADGTRKPSGYLHQVFRLRGSGTWTGQALYHGNSIGYMLEAVGRLAGGTCIYNKYVYKFESGVCWGQLANLQEEADEAREAAIEP